MSFVSINGTELLKLKKYKVQRNKLWTDADRNMAGALRATYIGMFPKLVLEFGYLDADEMTALIALLDTPSFTVLWYDESTQGQQSGTFYASDYELSYFDPLKELYEPFTVSLIPFTKFVPSV